MKVPALDERGGQMKHVGKVNVCDRERKKPCRQNWKDEEQKKAR